MKLYNCRYTASLTLKTLPHSGLFDRFFHHSCDKNRWPSSKVFGRHFKKRPQKQNNSLFFHFKSDCTNSSALCPRVQRVPLQHKNIWSLRKGQGSDLFISHLQKLGVNISRALPFLVEEELVVAAVSTNGYDSIGLCPEGTDTWRTWGNLKLGEAPFRAEVLWEEAGGGQTALLVPLGVLSGKDMHSPMIARHTDQWCILVKVNAVDVSGLGAPPQLLDQLTSGSVKYSY